ncbi:GatB/YqeY domain-containing protein [bacterium]|nr:GatB/YqeY domain-containing protein [bacterium]
MNNQPPLMKKIHQEIKKAVVARDQKKAESLKYLFSLLEKELMREGKLTEEEAVRILQKELKSKKEALSLFEKGGREDLVANEKREIALLEEFLPPEMSEEEIRKIVREVCQQTGDFGQVMGMVMKKLQGRAEGSKVAEIVRQELKR